MASLNWRQPSVTGLQSAVSTNGDMHFPDINQQAAQLDGIGKMILENKPLPDHISGKEGLTDLCIIEAIYKAANTGRQS